MKTAKLVQQPNANAEDIFQPTENVDIDLLVSNYEACKTGLATVASRSKKYSRIRLCKWGGQRDDGKKYGDALNPAYPWEGASDIKSYDVDAIINENVAFKILAFKRANISAIPLTLADSQKAGKARDLIKYLTSSAKMPEFSRELRIAANFEEEDGFAVVGVYWERNEELKYVFISSNELVSLSSTFASIVANPEYQSNELALSLAQDDVASLFELSQKDAKKLISDCLKYGAGQYPTTQIVKDAPRIKTFRVGYDIFFPENIDDLQKSPYVFTLDVMRPHELRAKVNAGLWNKDFVETVIASNYNKGDSTVNPESATGIANNQYRTDYAINIATAYYRSYDDKGRVSMRYAIFCPDNKEAGFAQCDILNYEPCRYPFELTVRESRARNALDSRGFAQVGESWQREIKSQRDARIDRTSLEATPPLFYTVGRKPTRFAPNAHIPTIGGVESIREARITPISSTSLEIERSARSAMGAYAGKLTDSTTQDAANAVRQLAIDSWLDFCARICSQIYLIHRQFGPELEKFIPVGKNEGEVVEVSTEDLLIPHSFHFAFDVAGSDVENSMKKFKLAIEAIQTLDRSGRANTDDLLDALFNYLFPDIAPSLMTNEHSADKREVLETQADLAKLYSGQNVNAPEHARADLRMQIIQEYISQADIQAKLATDEAFSSRIANYTKMLQFQVQQRENAIIGRLGAKPGNAEPTNLSISNE